MENNKELSPRQQKEEDRKKRMEIMEQGKKSSTGLNTTFVGNPANLPPVGNGNVLQEFLSKDLKLGDVNVFRSLQDALTPLPSIKSFEEVSENIKSFREQQEEERKKKMDNLENGRSQSKGHGK